jgi:hypothetical protein
MPSSGSDDESDYRSEASGSAPATAAAAAKREGSSAGPADEQVDGESVRQHGIVAPGQGDISNGAASKPAGGPGTLVPDAAAAAERLSRLDVDS